MKKRYVKEFINDYLNGFNSPLISETIKENARTRAGRVLKYYEKGYLTEYEAIKSIVLYDPCLDKTLEVKK